MNTSPLVSVIMANFNGMKFIGSAMRSLMGQTLRSWELIVVDDASTDLSVATARATARADPRVTIVEQPENRGPAAARNRALGLARGQWIAIFDSDDLMAPRRLEGLLDRAQSDRAAIVADNLLLFSEAAPKPQPYLKHGLGEAPHWIGLTDLFESNCLYSRMPDLGYLKPMVRAELIAQIAARYDERLRIGEDYHFLASLLSGGHRLRLEPSPLYLYRKHESSISHRIGADHIRALIDADERFRKRALSPRQRKSLDRRRQSLEALLVYDGVVDAIKQGRPAQGAVLAVRHPRVWPLLTRPLTARLKRVGQALGAA